VSEFLGPPAYLYTIAWWKIHGIHLLHWPFPRPRTTPLAYPAFHTPLSQPLSRAKMPCQLPLQEPLALRLNPQAPMPWYKAQKGALDDTIQLAVIAAIADEAVSVPHAIIPPAQPLSHGELQAMHGGAET
jgi:hypothetical protein